MTGNADLSQQLILHYTAKNEAQPSERTLDALEHLWDQLNENPLEVWQTIYFAQGGMTEPEHLAKLAAAHFEELVRSNALHIMVENATLDELDAMERLVEFVWFSEAAERQKVTALIFERKKSLYKS